MFMKTEKIKPENYVGPVQGEETVGLQGKERMWTDMRKKDRRTDRLRSSGQKIKGKAG